MNFCFHHVPKTAGTTLQHRLCHREWIGELPTGSTLVVTPIGSTTTMYRVKDDLHFNPNQPIKQAYERFIGRQSIGNATIVMGHLTTHAQVGKHFTWLRHPLERDLSHYKYDLTNNKTLANNPFDHFKKIKGNFYVNWFWKFYLGNHNKVNSYEEMVEKVILALGKFEKIWDHKNFEDTWIDICKMLKISVNPLFNSNISVEKNIMVNKEFKIWHEKHNQYDYYIYNKFCG